jgi:rhomboid protease GluP
MISMTRGVSQTDFAVKILLSLNILYFAISLLLSLRIEGTGGFFSPNQNSLLMLGATGTIPIDRFGRIWSLLSANYLHGGLLHLLFNMMALHQLAPRVVNEYGSSRMVTIYTLGGIIGYTISYFAGVPFTVGASAAICSLIGALLYFGKSRAGAYGRFVYREVSGWIISLFIFGLLFSGINNWAHGGGLFGGILLGTLLGYNEKKNVSVFHHSLALICSVMTISALGWAIFGAKI